jgi:AraC-like DNA-binding protein
MGPEAEVELVTQADFGAAAVTFFGTDMRRAARHCGIGGPTGTVTVIRARQPDTVDELRAEMEAMLSARGKQASPSLDDPDRLLRRAALSLAKGTEVQPRSDCRAAAVERAIVMIRSCGAKPIKVPELCKIAQVSERTLRRAFLEHYLLPPARLIKACRLNQLRWELVGLKKEGSLITEIAKRAGFRNLGQFASDYRQWFGELPSATRRRHLWTAPVSEPGPH